MSIRILGAVLMTIGCCTIAAIIVLRRNERRHEREMLRRDEEWRQVAWQLATGARPPGLSAADRAEFDAITGRLKRQDAGIGIFRSERETT